MSIKIVDEREGKGVTFAKTLPGGVYKSSSSGEVYIGTSNCKNLLRVRDGQLVVASNFAHHVTFIPVEAILTLK